LVVGQVGALLCWQWVLSERRRHRPAPFCDGTDRRSFEKIVFKSVPATPAINKWTKLAPVCDMLIFGLLLGRILVSVFAALGVKREEPLGKMVGGSNTTFACTEFESQSSWPEPVRIIAHLFDPVSVLPLLFV
jgi:hypothetical protein